MLEDTIYCRKCPYDTKPGGENKHSDTADKILGGVVVSKKEQFHLLGAIRRDFMEEVTLQKAGIA